MISKSCAMPPVPAAIAGRDNIGTSPGGHAQLRIGTLPRGRAKGGIGQVVAGGMPMRFEKVTFAGSQGATLAGRLELPDGEPVAYALFAHCFTCTKDIFAAGRIAEELARHAIAVLRFDFTGLGASGREFAHTNFTSNVDDLVKAADFLRESYMPARILIGHSLGGAATLAAAHRIPEAVAVATIAAPADPAHVAHLLTDKREEIEAKGEAEVLLAGGAFPAQKQIPDDKPE